MNHIKSPDTSDAGIERLIKAKGKTAPRVTLKDIENVIVEKRFFTAWEGAQLSYWSTINDTTKVIQSGEPDPDGPLSLLTFCVLVLHNGFTVTGESACASPENFDSEIGRQVAYENAINKIWPLLGYELKTKLSGDQV